MMKQTMIKQIQRLTGARGLPLVALALLGLVSALPGWASAQSETPTTFTSPLPGPGHHHRGPNDELRELLETIVDREAILAEAIGITVEELAAAKEAGVSVHDLIEQAGLDEETVRSEIKTAMTAAIQQAVTDGVITPEQADALLNPPARPQPDGDQGPGGHNGHRGEGESHQHPGPVDGTPATATPAATPEATTTVEATATPEATIAANAAAESTATPEANEPRRPRHERPAANDSDATTATDNSDTTTDTATAGDEQASTDEQPPAAPQNQDGGHRRGGR